MMNLKTRRGDSYFLNSVLSILIAAVCIGIIIVMVARIYLANKNFEKENAAEILDVIIGKIDLLKYGEGRNYDIRGVEAGEKAFFFSKEWYLVGFTKSNNAKITKCFFRSCLCICKLSSGSNLEDVCFDVNTGICRNIDFDEVKLEGGKVILDKPLNSIKITKSEKIIDISVVKGG